MPDALNQSISLCKAWFNTHMVKKLSLLRKFQNVINYAILLFFNAMKFWSGVFLYFLSDILCPGTFYVCVTNIVETAKFT